MKYAKLVIAMCGAVGLVEIAVPIGGSSLLAGLFEIDKLEALVYVAIFALPLAMGVLSLVRPPLLAWQSAVALAGFVVGVSRFRVWHALLHLSLADLPSAIRVVAIVVGTLASVAALLRPEAPA